MPNKSTGKKHQSGRTNGYLTVILFAALIYMATVQVKAWWSGQSATKITPRAVTPRADLREDEKATINLFEETSPSVVFITTINLRRDFFSTNIYKIPAGTGSGFIWDRAGHVVTNYHVIRGADQAKITLWDQSTWDAKLIGAEPDKDLAVLKIQAPDERLRPIKIGESKNLLVGQKAYAIGNPFGFDQTLTTGVISALGREIESVTRRPITGVIQTNAAINPGNSGGALINDAGFLIGINTFTMKGNTLINFAVAVNEIENFIVSDKFVELETVNAYLNSGEANNLKTNDVNSKAKNSCTTWDGETNIRELIVSNEVSHDESVTILKVERRCLPILVKYLKDFTDGQDNFKAA